MKRSEHGSIINISSRSGLVGIPGAAAYAATDLPEHQGQHWRDYGRLLESGGPDALADVFRAWFWQPHPTKDLIRDPAP